jgi:hypothetical protein
MKKKGSLKKEMSEYSFLTGRAVMSYGKRRGV